MLVLQFDKTPFLGVHQTGSRPQGQILRQSILEYIKENIRIFDSELHKSLEQHVSGYIAAIDHSAYELEGQKREKLQSLSVHKDAVTRILREQKHWNEWNNSMVHVDAEMV